MVRPAPGLTIEQQPQHVLKVMALWGEARGEDAFTKLCILWVIRNRMTKRKTTWREEILRPFAFSCFNHDDPNVSKLLLGYLLEPGPWAACETVCDLISCTMDPTRGADHYYALSMNPPPKWGRGHPEWQERITTGDMVFGVCP